MKKFIYVRASPDWHNINTIEEYEAANREARMLLKNWMPDLVDAILKWNRTFNMNYFQFRAKMKDITAWNLNQIPGAVVINKQTKSLLDTTEDFLLFATDDDDWVAPWVFDVVEKKRSDEDHIITWPFGYFRDSHIQVTDPELPIHDIKWVYSNNTVTTARGYKFYKRVCEMCDFLEDHREADVYSKYPECKVHVIDDVLSAYNHSPASATKIWGFTRECKLGIPKQEIKRLTEFYSTLPPIPEPLEWARPYAQKVWDTISELTTPKPMRKLFV